MRETRTWRGNSAASQHKAAASARATGALTASNTRARAAAGHAPLKKVLAAGNAASVPDVLKPGHILRSGHALRSADGKYVLLQQTDGNLVLYQGHTALWGTMTASPRAYTAMQADGNLVIYNQARQVLWSAGTAPSAGAFLTVQDDGNVVVYSKSGKWLRNRYLFLQLLPSGSVLSPGQAILPHDRHYALAMQADGNLVLYHGSLYGAKTAVWGTMTSSPGAYAVMQTDGNLVVYSPAQRVLWSSSSSSPGAYLTVQDDGNVVIYDTARKPLWDRHLYLQKLGPGSVLKATMAVVSADWQHELLMQSDGNLVPYQGPLYGTMKAVWSTMTSSPGAYAVMQTDGNLVVYSPAGHPLWSTATSSPGAYLWLGNDGNVVLDSAARRPLWSTDTAGK